MKSKLTIISHGAGIRAEPDQVAIGRGGTDPNAISGIVGLELARRSSPDASVHPQQLRDEEESGVCGTAAGSRVAKQSDPDALRVWLVDDDEPVRVLLATLFRSIGVDCSRHFGSAAAALGALASEANPDAILLDVNLRNESGIDAIRPFKARAPLTPVLMLTTFYDAISREQALRAGASDFLLKTYSVNKIARAIYLACGRADSSSVARAA